MNSSDPYEEDTKTKNPIAGRVRAGKLGDTQKIAQTTAVTNLAEISKGTTTTMEHQ